MTTTVYATPPAPQRVSASPGPSIVCQGALRIAETSSTSQKCTIVGVPKASSDGAFMARASAPNATTTNCRPVNAAAEEPMMT